MVRFYFETALMSKKADGMEQLLSFGPTHEILVLLAYTQKPPLNVHADVNNCLKFVWGFIYIHTLCMLEPKALGSLCI